MLKINSVSAGFREYCCYRGKMYVQIDEGLFIPERYRVNCLFCKKFFMEWKMIVANCVKMCYTVYE